MTLQNAFEDLALDSTVQEIRDALTDPSAPLPVAAVFSDSNGVPFGESNPLPVDVANLTVENLNVTFPDSIVSTGNSPSAALGAGGTFSGAWEEVTSFSAISVIVMTDAASATNGAVVDFSTDGVGIARSIAATIPANVGLTFMFAPEARYFRLRYTNGATPQTFLRTQTLLHYQTPSPPQLPVSATTTDISLGESTMAHTRGRHSSGMWVPMAVTSGGAQIVDDGGGSLTVDGTVAISNLPATQPVSGTVAVSSLPEVEVKNDSGNPLTVQGTVTVTPSGTQAVSGTVSVGNFPTTTEIANDVGNPIPAADDYLTGTIATSQAGAGAVLTFNLSQYVTLLWVRDVGATTTNVSWADPFGGTPANGTGIPVPNGEPVPITVRTNSVKVWAPAGSTIAVYGYGR